MDQYSLSRSGLPDSVIVIGLLLPPTSETSRLQRIVKRNHAFLSAFETDEITIVVGPIRQSTGVRQQRSCSLGARYEAVAVEIVAHHSPLFLSRQRRWRSALVSLWLAILK